MYMATIFVSIASYRDPVCSATVRSLLENADDPSLIFIGIVQQNSPFDAECVDATTLRVYPRNNIRILRLEHFEAKGPCYARYLASTLWKGEDYYFQIDSHTKFIKSWDTKLKKMIQDLYAYSSKPCLSHYPLSMEEYKPMSVSFARPQICSAFLNDRGMLSYNESRNMFNNDTGMPYKKTLHFAAGFFFAPSKFLNDVPYDPNLDFVFVGEEILHACRLFTNGWDIYVPNENIAFHEYTRADKPKFWDDILEYSDLQAFNKIKRILKLSKQQKVEDSKYGLGSLRTLEEFYEGIGFDIETGIVFKNECNSELVDQYEYKKVQLYRWWVKYNYIVVPVIMIALSWTAWYYILKSSQ